MRKAANDKIPLDHILFKGGSDLTAFQSIGLLAIGLAFVLLVGLPMLVYEFRLKLPDRDAGMLLTGIAMTLWGLVMVVNAARAVLRLRKKRKTPRSASDGGH
jgi:hypothetical protein